MKAVILVGGLEPEFSHHGIDEFAIRCGYKRIASYLTDEDVFCFQPWRWCGRHRYKRVDRLPSSAGAFTTMNAVYRLGASALSKLIICLHFRNKF